ncbi:MAG: thioredoxin family protein [Planctomycetaceae bacterium]
MASDQKPAVQWRTDLKLAEAEVEKTGKPLLLQFTATWCVYCHRMLKNTYTAPDVTQLVNQRFIPIQVDADRHPEIIRALKIDSFPTTVVISSDKKRWRKISGYKKPTELRRILFLLGQQLSRSEIQPVSAGRSQPRQPRPVVGAFQNRCLVSLVDDRKLVEGRPECAIRYQGQIVCFASEDHRDRFQQSPRKYWPVLDGACPVSHRLAGERVIGDPKLGVFYDGRVWLFSSPQRQAQFLADPEPYR